jgi:hypothetical protein
MNTDQAHRLIEYAKALDPRTTASDPDTIALAAVAWSHELPLALAMDEARVIVHELHREGHRITPGAIGRRYDELHTPKHQQGVTRQPRPTPPPRPAPPALPGVKVGRQISDTDTEPLRGEAVAAILRPAGDTSTPPTPGLDRRCPYCGAAPFKPCTTGTGKPLTQGSRVHPARISGTVERNLGA